MSKGNTFELDFLKLVFNATAIANIADNAASSPLTSLYLALHTADPGEAADPWSTVLPGAYSNEEAGKVIADLKILIKQTKALTAANL